MGVLLGIFGHLILVLLHLAVVAVDLVFLALLAKFLRTIWPQIALFTAFDRAGSPIIDPVIDFTQRVGSVSYRGVFPVISLVLTAARFFLVAITHSILAV